MQYGTYIPSIDISVLATDVYKRQKVIFVDDAATITPYYSESNEDLKTVIDEIKQQKNVVTVASEAEAYPALLNMDVRPRAELVGSNEQILSLIHICTVWLILNWQIW